MRLADRSEAYRAAGAFLRSLDHLQRWEREARAVSFLDDEYAASQLLKSDWERLGGETVCGWGAKALKALDPLGAANLPASRACQSQWNNKP